MEKPFYHIISLRSGSFCSIHRFELFCWKKYNAFRLVCCFQCELNSVTMHLHIHRNMTSPSAVCSAGLAQADQTNQNGAPTAMMYVCK